MWFSPVFSWFICFHHDKPNCQLLGSQLTPAVQAAPRTGDDPQRRTKARRVPRNPPGRARSNVPEKAAPKSMVEIDDIWRYFSQFPIWSYRKSTTNQIATLYVLNNTSKQFRHLGKALYSRLMAITNHKLPSAHLVTNFSFQVSVVPPLTEPLEGENASNHLQPRMVQKELATDWHNLNINLVDCMNTLNMFIYVYITVLKQHMSCILRVTLKAIEKVWSKLFEWKKLVSIVIRFKFIKPN